MPVTISADSKWATAAGALAFGAIAGTAATCIFLRGKKERRQRQSQPFRCYQQGKGEHARFHFERLPADEMVQRASDYAEFLDTRRTVRFFSPDVPPLEAVEKCVRAAGTAPSGAHLQPWFFAIVKDQDLKVQIREAVEAEEQQNYDQRMKKSWVADVKGMVANVHEGDAVRKPYLTEAPYIVVMFKQTSSLKADGSTQTHYYASESTGIAAGMFLTALHNANLATLTSTPMGAEAKIRKILGRPETEKVFLLMPVGWPAANATVPNRPNNGRKALEQIAKIY